MACVYDHKLQESLNNYANSSEKSFALDVFHILFYKNKLRNGPLPPPLPAHILKKLKDTETLGDESKRYLFKSLYYYFDQQNQLTIYEREMGEQQMSLLWDWQYGSDFKKDKFPNTLKKILDSRCSTEEIMINMEKMEKEILLISCLVYSKMLPLNDLVKYLSTCTTYYNWSNSSMSNEIWKSYYNQLTGCKLMQICCICWKPYVVEENGPFSCLIHPGPIEMRISTNLFSDDIPCYICCGSLVNSWESRSGCNGLKHIASEDSYKLLCPSKEGVILLKDALHFKKNWKGWTKEYYFKVMSYSSYPKILR